MHHWLVEDYGDTQMLCSGSCNNSEEYMGPLQGGIYDGWSLIVSDINLGYDLSNPGEWVKGTKTTFSVVADKVLDNYVLEVKNKEKYLWIHPIINK